jgi:serine/threonine-protein kinase
MKRLESEPLTGRLSHGVMPVADTVQIGLEVLDALEALHSRGITHRHLKPSNIFLTPHGARCR